MAVKRKRFPFSFPTQSKKSSPKSDIKSEEEPSSQSKTKPKKLSSQPHTKVPGFMVPPDVKTLNDLSKVAGIATINDLPQNCLGSGSDVTQRQFLALRIIFARKIFEKIKKETYWKDWDLDRLSTEAERLVDDCPEFQAYFKLISTRTPVRTVAKRSSNWPGSLKPVKVFHEQILRKRNQEAAGSERTSRELRPRSRPTKAVEATNSGHQATMRASMQWTPGEKSSEIHEPGSQRSEDNVGLLDDSDETSEAEDRPTSRDSDRTYVDLSEYLVAVKEPTTNSALIVLLQATCDLVFGVPLEWTLDPAHFRSKFRLGQFNVHTDGAMRSTRDERVLSIVEVKREMRDKHLEEIQMQEGVEMASWVLNSGKNTQAYRSIVYSSHKMGIASTSQWQRYTRIT